MALEKFIPQSPDRFIRNSKDFEVARFGHLNEMIDYINNYVLPDGLQLVGSGPMSTTLRAITDNLGNASRLSLSTDTTAISADLKFTGATSGFVAIQAPNTVTSYTLTLPTATGTPGQVLITDGSGNLSFGTISLNTGVLEIQGGVPLDGTLRSVTDQASTISPLSISTTAVQVNSTLKITTDSEPYLDVEDTLTNNRFTIGKAPASQKVYLDFASNPTGSTTIVGAIRTYTDGTNLNDIVQFREDGQVTFAERVNVEADSLVTTQTSSVIASTTTNANLVIAPNGTGALVASIPDGTATGGNARGNNAVDLQMFRTNSNQVARGANDVIAGGGENRNGTGAYQTIGGGSQNFANGVYTTISGGLANNAGNNYVFIGGGNANNGSGGQYTTIPGGRSNTASIDYSTVSGGQSNTASTGTHATVVGGHNNVSSGSYSVSGGYGNIASGSYSIAVGGNANIASGSFSTVSGGNVNNATGFQSTIAGGGSNTVSGQNSGVGAGEANTISSNYSFGIGLRTSGYLYGQFQSASGFFAAIGDAQQSSLTARRQDTLTTGATTILSLDGTGTTNLIIPNGNNRMWKVKVEYVGTITTITGTATGLAVGNSVYGEANFGFKRVAGVSSMGPMINDSQSSDNAIMDTCALVETAGASGELALTFTGPTFAGGGSVTMRVVAKVSLVEVAY